MGNNIETFKPINSVIAWDLNTLKESIKAQPHIEAMTNYTDEQVDATIALSREYHENIDTILS